MDWPRILTAVQTVSGQRSEDERLERTRAFVDGAFADPLTVPAMARHACLSREHFIRSFRAAYGITPRQYLTKKRVEHARFLLGATELSVTEVCMEVGFESLGSFSTMFRRYMGHSPERYRRLVVACLPIASLPDIPGCFAARFGGMSLFEKR